MCVCVCVCVCVSYYYRMTKELGLIKFYVSHHTKGEYYKAGERLQRLQCRVTVHTVI